MGYGDELRAYYEEEARLELRQPLQGRRVERRDQYVRQLHNEGAASVVDFGAGPGGDVQGFVDAGLRCVGIDLAVGNARIAASAGLTVVPASLALPPLRDGVFDAGWSMSTIMHLPDEAVPPAISAMAATLRSAAPLLIGMWGTPEAELHIDYSTIDDYHRSFYLRTPTRNRELLAGLTPAAEVEVWDIGPDNWHYQVHQLRT